MAERQFTVTIDGQEVRDTDLNSLGEVSGLADDRVFAELFRPHGIAAGGVPRGRFIIPFNQNLPQVGAVPQGRFYQNPNVQVVAPNGASGTTLVGPFRAVLGSATLASSSGLNNWKDGVRSGVHIGSTSGYYTQITHSANSSGNARIDLVYAIVTPDVNTSTVSRKVKNPSTGVITTQSISVSKVTNVSAAVVTGAPSGSPAIPTLPSDGGGNYYIALALVRIPNGFGASSTVALTDILHDSYHLPVSPEMGVSVVGPAQMNSQISELNTSVLSVARLASWATSGIRPTWFMSPSMIGEDTIWIAIDCTDATSSNWSHPLAVTGEVIDQSRNWSNRVFDAVVTGATGDWAWDPTPTGTSVPYALQDVYHVMGQSFTQDWATGQSRPLQIANSNAPSIMPGSERLTIYCDNPTGILYVDVSGQLTNKILIKLSASAPFNKY